MPFDPTTTNPLNAAHSLGTPRAGSHLQRGRVELRLSQGWLVTFALPAAIILWGGFLVLHRGPAHAVPALIPFLFIILAALLVAVSYAWRRTARFAYPLISEGERHALWEQGAEEELHAMQFEYREIFL